ncbi:Oidioi.mRNA.OKI2018_I69.chr1.g3668.t2.cds [Oikopleura dioica]|uniref:Oidioi.mRNA.OKI2018_I69.chr1.g3668.t2.cds n=1 Tax=Oikopleura dioica TaxID=34765 RepID=A0ABN7SYV3_OIKDI|nr:Oidioi.mRNA.OKI2018_I69.chr1.g3668.t2.cds [Oikopleura dioica]
MLGREKETKPLKWLKIENSETDEEDSALGSNISSASSEIGQHDYENTKKTVSSSANSITTSNMVKIEVLKAAKPVKIDFSSPASSEQYVVNSIKRYTRFRQREKKKAHVSYKDAPRKLRASVVPSSSSRSVSPTARLANLPNSRPQNKAQKQQQIFFISQSSAAFSTSNKSFSVADFNKIQEPKNKLELVQEWVQDQKTCSSISHRTESELDVDTQGLRMRSNLSKSTSDIAEASNYEDATLVFSRFPSSSGSNSASSGAASKSAALPNRAPKTGSSSGPASPDLNSCGSHSRKLKKNVSIPIDLRCPVCLDLYAKPLFLPCGHTFCKGCIKRVVDASEEQQKRLYQFFCPTCRNIIEYGEGGIDLLQKNMKMAQAITKYEFHGGIKRRVSSYQENGSKK